MLGPLSGAPTQSARAIQARAHYERVLLQYPEANTIDALDMRHSAAAELTAAEQEDYDAYLARPHWVAWKEWQRSISPWDELCPPVPPHIVLLANTWQHEHPGEPL